MLYNQDLGKLLLRLAVGGLMLLYGIHKILNGVGGVEALLESRGLPGFLAYGAYVGEVLAPLMLIVGFRVRLAALLMILTMLVAIYAVYGFNIFTLNDMGGLAIELQLLFIMPCLALIFMGGGRYGISFRS